MHKLILVALMVVGSSGALGKTITCDVDPGEDSKGWIPDSFTLDVSDDRQLIGVIEPRLEVFGSKDFEKATFGSSYWSRGKGKAQSGQTHSFQLQLSLKDDDSKYWVELSLHQYRPIRVKGTCSEGGDTSSVNRGMYNRDTAKNISKEECGELLNDSNPQFTVYGGLKLRKIAPREVETIMRASPVMEACIDKFRGDFPPIRQFIKTGEWKTPLSATECNAMNYTQEAGLYEMLAKFDAEFGKIYEASTEKAVIDWCKGIFD
ncbi:hypothetical protein N9448_03420 [Litorivicinus sp.]|nr:hypothetical protein [Litorivicinus sp.]